MIRTLIVDDEPLALDVLETYISQMDQLELVARCENAFEAQKILKAEDIDLLFLDIQMPQLTGVEFLKTLSNPPLTVFTTAYSEYAVEGFELDVVDYLLKPISLERFIKAVNKAEERHEANQSANEQLGGEDYFFVKADKKLVRVDFDQILYIEGLKDYVIIRMTTGRVITLQTMKSLEHKLPADIFRRIHRSYIINLKKIKAITGNMVEIIEKDQTKQIPIGKNYRDELLELVNKNRL
jgi:DNA-binding LytR/AlgR family response regulator